MFYACVPSVNLMLLFYLPYIVPYVMRVAVYPCCLNCYAIIAMLVRLVFANAKFIIRTPKANV